VRLEVVAPESSSADLDLTETDPSAAPAGGTGIIRASWIGTGVFSVSAVATAIAPTTFIAVGVGVAMLLFFVGIAIFVWAYAVAVNRSRQDDIGLGGLFFLTGSAPRSVQISLLGSFAVEVVVGLVTAAVHPFTPLAFGVLASMYGLALCGLWAAKWGTFPPRQIEEPRRKKSSSANKSSTTGKGTSSAKGGGGGKGRSRGGSGRVTPKATQGGRSRSRAT
jgi:hypothetical protein